MPEQSEIDRLEKILNSEDSAPVRIAVDGKVVPAATEAPHSEIWQHVKSGGLYTVLCGDAQHSEDCQPLVVYKSLRDGQVWVRGYHEFYDGRFRNLMVEEVTDVRDEDDKA